MNGPLCMYIDLRGIWCQFCHTKRATWRIWQRFTRASLGITFTFSTFLPIAIKDSDRTVFWITHPYPIVFRNEWQNSIIGLSFPLLCQCVCDSYQSSGPGLSWETLVHWETGVSGPAGPRPSWSGLPQPGRRLWSSSPCSPSWALVSEVAMIVHGCMYVTGIVLWSRLHMDCT